MPTGNRKSENHNPVPPPNFSPDEVWVGPKQVAYITGMTVRWVQETFRYEVKPMKVGGRLRWPLWQVKAWQAQQAAASR
jgi:hypothetical protein